MKIELLHAYGENFLQYHELDIPLASQGLVGLFGQREDDLSRSNGTGKSSAISLPPWIIWEKILRDVRLVDRVIKYGEKSCMGRLEARVDGEDVWLERRRTSTGGIETKASFVGTSRKADITREIEEVFGSFSLAQNTRFLAQNKALEFLSSGDANRRRILEDLLQIARWRRPYEAASKDLEWAERAMATAQTEKTLAMANAERICMEIKHIREIAVQEIQTRLTLLDEQLQRVDQEAQKAAKLMDQSRAEYNKIHEDRLNGEATGRTMSASLHTLEKQIEVEEFKLTQYRKAHGTGVCPTCGQTVEHDHSVEMTECQRSIKLLKDKVEADRLSFTAKKTEWDKLYVIDDKTKTALDLAVADCIRLRKEALDVRQARNAQQDKLAEASKVDVSEKQVELAEQERIISTRTRLIAKLEAGIQTMSRCKEGFSYRGIPSSLVARSLPLLSQQTSQFMEVFTDGENQVEISASDIKKDGDLIDRMAILISNRNGEWEFLGDKSEGEQRRFIISLFLALPVVQELVTDTSWNITFIDELFDRLDSHGVSRAIRILNELKRDRTVVITSHRTELKELAEFDHVWTTTQTDDGAVLHT